MKKDLFSGRAAQYVRMSTDHQKYSIDNQQDAIDEYARKHDLEIVRTYRDDGKSGLSLSGRDGLAHLLEDIEASNINFDTILVFDVSRWGRFQDADESAYYEYLCKRANIRVVYCAEQFENDGSPQATIFKSVKRAMAGEYSRELSKKVFAGQCRLIEMGYRQGGPAGFGLRRQLVDQFGVGKQILSVGERKSLQTDRVILVPGPDQEVTIIKKIYHWFVEDGKSEGWIAEELNREAASDPDSLRWTRGIVRHILSNEKYIGNNVFNRQSFKLKQRRIANPPEKWIRCDGAFEAIVDPSLFYQAQGIFKERTRRFSDEEMLSNLKTLYQQKGLLSGLIIDEYEHMPSSHAYRLRFGSLVRAYELVGFNPDRDYSYLEINKRLRELHKSVVADVTDNIEKLGGRLQPAKDSHLFHLNNELDLSLIIARSRALVSGKMRWKLWFETSLKPDITVAVRMDGENKKPLDYYIFPHLDICAQKLNLGKDNGVELDLFRFSNLNPLFELSRRFDLGRVA